MREKKLVDQARVGKAVEISNKIWALRQELQLLEKSMTTKEFAEYVSQTKDTKSRAS